MNCSTPGLPVHHQLPEFTQTGLQGPKWPCPCTPASFNVTTTTSTPSQLSYISDIVNHLPILLHRPWYTLHHLPGTHSTRSLTDSLSSFRCLLMLFPTESPPGLCSGFPSYVGSLWHPLYCFIIFCCCLCRDCRPQQAVIKSILYTAVSLALSTVQHIVNKYLLNKWTRGEGKKSAVWTNRKGWRAQRQGKYIESALSWFLRLLWNPLSGVPKRCEKVISEVTEPKIMLGKGEKKRVNDYWWD